MTIRSVTTLRRTTMAGMAAVALLVASNAQATCGDPNNDGKVLAGDALLTLRAAVTHTGCTLEACDVDMNGTITTADALRVLRAAAGLPPPLACALAGLVPPDPDFPSQYALATIHAPEAWERRTDCSRVIVSVVDSGIDYFHDDLIPNLWNNPGEIAHNHKDDDGNGFADDVHGWDFSKNDEYPWDADSHGTHVSGIIGAAANDIGTVGVCWEAQIMAVRFLDETGAGFASDALQAIDYSRKNGASVINNSWGGGPKDSGLYYAFNAANDADIVLVVAAGNDTEDNDNVPTYPAQFQLPTQINVAATTSTDALAGFSNFGATTVHIAAPGEGILSTVPFDDYAVFDGTSMAAPMVAGAAALIRSEFPSLSATQVKRAIINSARPVDALDGVVVADGILDVEAALELAEDIVLGADLVSAASVATIASAPAPALRERRVTAKFRDDTKKYSKLESAVETFSDGSSRSVTMVADHLVVSLDDPGAIAAIEKAGFRIKHRLATDRTTVLVDAPDGTEEDAARLAGIAGVSSVNPDYVLTAK